MSAMGFRIAHALRARRRHVAQITAARTSAYRGLGDDLARLRDVPPRPPARTGGRELTDSRDIARPDEWGNAGS